MSLTAIVIPPRDGAFGPLARRARDRGVRLAFDIYRPARDGDPVGGRFPTIMLHTGLHGDYHRPSDTADKINAESPDAVYYAGFYPQTAPLLTALRKAGVTAAFVSSDGSNAQQFLDVTDTAANGTTISCGCAPAPDAFAKQYAALIKQDPGAYSTESYDLATILLTAVDGGKGEREMRRCPRSIKRPALDLPDSGHREGEDDPPSEESEQAEMTLLHADLAFPRPGRPPGSGSPKCLGPPAGRGQGAFASGAPRLR